MNKDLRTPAPKLHTNEAEKDTTEHFTDLCPSWMGQVF